MRIRLAAAVVPLLLSACVTRIDAPVAVASGLPLALLVVSGNSQSAVAGSELAQPLVVRVEDSKGKRVVGQIIAWRVVTGGGSAFAGVSITNKDGEARERWTLGPPGEQRMEARAVDTETGDALTFGAFTATSLAPAQLSISESSFNYGTSLVGVPTTAHTFTVTNVGGVAAGAGTVSLTGAGAASFALTGNSCAGVSLAAGASCTVAAAFNPAAPGAVSASLSVAATPGGSVSAALSGTGATPAALAISPASFAFGSTPVGNSSAVQAFTVTNTGGSPTGTVAATLAGPDLAHFSVTGTTCTSNLAAGASCAVSVRFQPTSTGNKTASLSVSASPGGTVTSALTGTGVAGAQLTISPPTQDFGNIAVTIPSGPRSFTISNTGGLPAAGLTVTLAGADAIHFVIVSNTCPASLNPGANCVVDVRFLPLSTGARSVLLTASSTSGSTASATLTGTGSLNGGLSLSPSSFNFGPVNLGSGPLQVFTVTNNGSVAAGPVMLSVTGSAEFSIVGSTCGAGVTPAAPCSITVRFAPTFTGAKSAVLNVASPQYATVTANLSGVGVAAAAMLSISPISWDFGTTGLGSSVRRTFTLSNSGGSPSGTLGFSIVGPATPFYSITSNTCPAVLAVSDSCDIEVAFAPTVNGTFPATLQITQAPGTGLTVGLTGAGGVPASLTISPSPVAFGTVAISVPVDRSLVISNVGGATAGLTTPLSFAISGTNAADFVFVGTSCGTTLAGGATCGATVRFLPRSSGFKSATLTLTAAAGGPAAVSLTGTAP
jgi:hypothetical protein